jgi:hypothetical protein
VWRPVHALWPHLGGGIRSWRHLHLNTAAIGKARRHLGPQRRIHADGREGRVIQRRAATVHRPSRVLPIQHRCEVQVRMRQWEAMTTEGTACARFYMLSASDKVLGAALCGTARTLTHVFCMAGQRPHLHQHPQQSRCPTIDPHCTPCQQMTYAPERVQGGYGPPARLRTCCWRPAGCMHSEGPPSPPRCGLASKGQAMHAIHLRLKGTAAMLWASYSSYSAICSGQYAICSGYQWVTAW